jgi:hypothetical protein
MNATQNLASGWAIGNTKGRANIKVFHFFPAGSKVAACNQSVRSDRNPIVPNHSSESGYNCSRCHAAKQRKGL